MKQGSNNSEISQRGLNNSDIASGKSIDTLNSIRNNVSKTQRSSDMAKSNTVATATPTVISKKPFSDDDYKFDSNVCYQNYAATKGFFMIIIMIY